MKILLLGGSCQGKTALAVNRCDIEDIVVNGKTDSFEVLEQGSCLLHFEEAARRLYRDGYNLKGFAEKLMKKRNIIVTADLIGCGIVPMEKEEREFRDLYGLVLQEMAARANQVIRVTAGIEMILKNNEVEDDELL